MHLAFALPPPAQTGAGGGADYIDGLAHGLRDIGCRVDVLVGAEPTFPAGAIPVIDGMLLPSLGDRLDELAASNAVALIHHVAAASGRGERAREPVQAVEQVMLARLRRTVATSEPVAHQLETTFGIAAHALPPGMRDHEQANPDPDAPLILSVGVITRRKGHDRLLRAAARLSDLPWHLVIAGDNQRDPAHAAELQGLADSLGLADRLTILADPTPEALEHAWNRATVFTLPSRWEGYPAAVAEALQRGIPVLTTTGANAETLLPLAAGAIVPLDDEATFGKCLRRLLFDDALRAGMVVAARAAGQALPRWPDRAKQFVSLLEQCP